MSDTYVREAPDWRQSEGYDRLWQDAGIGDLVALRDALRSLATDGTKLREVSDHLDTLPADSNASEYKGGLAEARHILSGYYGKHREDIAAAASDLIDDVDAEIEREEAELERWR